MLLMRYARRKSKKRLYRGYTVYRAVPAQKIYNELTRATRMMGINLIICGGMKVKVKYIKKFWLVRLVLFEG